jgi:hypothetical protein
MDHGNREAITKTTKTTTTVIIIIIMDITRRRRSTGPTEEAWIHEAVRETGGRGKTTTLVT